MDFKSVQDQLQGAFNAIDENTRNIKVLDVFEQKTHLPRSYAVVAFGIVYLVMIFMNFGGIGELLSNVAGFMYPFYSSLKALETSSKDDDTRLLTYWVVFAFLNLIEFWSGAILYWIPAYFLFKTLFLVYLSSPVTNGAQVVYGLIIKPLGDKVLHTNSSEGPADNLMDKVQNKID